MPRQVLWLPGRVRPPCVCRIRKNSRKVKISRPKATVSTCYRCFLRACIRPSGADAGRKRTSTRPDRARYPQRCALLKRHSKAQLCTLGRVGRVKSSSPHFSAWLKFRVRSFSLLHITDPDGGSSTRAEPGTARSAKETCL